MTNQQGAPEALPPAFIHYPPKKPELARVDFLPMATREERGNGWVTAALVEAQQPAPSAAAYTGELRRAFEPQTVDQEWGSSHSLAYPSKAAQIINAARALLATTPQADSQPAPVMDGTPPPCEQELFDQGVSVGLFDLPKWTVEEICRGIAAATGARVDWHYIGGRVHIKALPAARALEDSVTAPAGGVDDDVDAIALARYKVVPAHESMFHRFAVVAGDGKQQLYLGHEIECANMARKFAGAFLDGAFYQANIAPTPPAQAADSVLEDAARLERERICAAIKAEDDYCVDQGDYMLDSDDCIKIARGEWVRPDFAIDAARKQGGA